MIDLHHNRQFAKPHKGGGAGYSRRQTRAAVWDARQQLFDSLGDFERHANADLAAALQIDLQASLDRYQALKAAEGALDFVDLLLEARTLLRDNAEVRRTFRERLTHLFIDEFQDTDPLQAEILILLSGDPEAGHGQPGELGGRPSPSGLALHRRRPQAVDLPVPPRRRRDLPESLPVAGRAGCSPRLADHQLPRDAVDSASRERGIRTADDG